MHYEITKNDQVSIYYFLSNKRRTWIGLNVIRVQNVKNLISEDPLLLGSKEYLVAPSQEPIDYALKKQRKFSSPFFLP